jgi:hypothetical protein
MHFPVDNSSSPTVTVAGSDPSVSVTPRQQVTRDSSGQILEPVHKKVWDSVYTKVHRDTAASNKTAQNRTESWQCMVSWSKPAHVITILGQCTVTVVQKF